MNKKVYISVPISGHDETQVREHIDLMKAALSRVGHKAVSPFDVYAGKNPDYFDYLCADLHELSKCDAIFLCKGWQFSKGCQVEAHFARTFGKEIMYEEQPNSDPYYFNR